jgi:hypothetical protein
LDLSLFSSISKSIYGPIMVGFIVVIRQ